MALFQSILTLLALAVLLLQASRHLKIPYPAMLAMAGLAVAALPWAPDISIDPHLMLALFIAPAILDAAFDFPLSAIRRYWPPLLALAIVAVLLTTAAVAWAGVLVGGLPISAAIVLGAIVSPPDAAAATAMLNHSDLPRSTATVLKGESLLNDAVALFIFGVALRVGASGAEVHQVLPQLALAIPGGLVLGILAGRLAAYVLPFLSGTLGGILFQFIVTFSTWMLAERLGMSAILALVAAAMTVAQRSGGQSAADRVHSNAVWGVVVFVLNVLAFLFVGLEARAIVRDLAAQELVHAIRFSLLILAIVIVVRVAWVMLYNRIIQRIYHHFGLGPAPSIKQGIVTSWCGMRGMVTLAAALALPASFPHRGLVVLSAFTVVLGTLVLQGLTLAPLVRLLGFSRDLRWEEDMLQVRRSLASAGLLAIADRYDGMAQALRLELERELLGEPIAAHPREDMDSLRIDIIRTQRETLNRLRRETQLDEAIYRALEQELDLREVAAERQSSFELADS
jgi:CPA1 family monovalent cation:H+ antiporter